MMHKSKAQAEHGHSLVFMKYILEQCSTASLTIADAHMTKGSISVSKADSDISKPKSLKSGYEVKNQE